MEQLPPSNQLSFRGGGDESSQSQQPSANRMEFLEQQRRAAVIQAAQERKCSCRESGVALLYVVFVRPRSRASDERLKRINF
jgi:hypothetical protein